MRQGLLELAPLLFTVAMLLPSRALAWLRGGQPLLAVPLNWLEGLWPGVVDLDHAITVLLRLLWPRAQWW